MQPFLDEASWGQLQGVCTAWLKWPSEAWPSALVTLRWPAALLSGFDHVEGQLLLILGSATSGSLEVALKSWSPFMPLPA